MILAIILIVIGVIAVNTVISYLFFKRAVKVSAGVIEIQQMVGTEMVSEVLEGLNCKP